MTRRRNKFNWKNLLAGALSVLVVAGAVFGIAQLAGKETRSIGGGAFSVGGISSTTGEWLDSQSSIYTEDLFGCQGLEVVPAFGTKSTYQIFFYNEDGIYIESTEILSGKFVASELPACAHSARVVIYPSTLDENGKEIEDFKIRFWEVRGIAKDFKMTVNKEQVTLNILDMLVPVAKEDVVLDEISTAAANGHVYLEGTCYNGSYTETSDVWANCSTSDNKDLDGLLILNASELASVKVVNNNDTKNLPVYVVNADGSITAAGNITVKAGNEMIVDCSESAFVLINVYDGMDIEVREYMPLG